MSCIFLGGITRFELIQNRAGIPVNKKEDIVYRLLIYIK